MAAVLRKGDTGKAVREIQGLLNSKCGKPTLKPDGHFGAKTEAAIKEFQGSLKLKVDGVVGAKTWSALHNQALKARFDNCVAAHDWFSIPKLEAFFNELPAQLQQEPKKVSLPAQKSAVSTAKTAPIAAPSSSITNSNISAPAIVKGSDFKNYQRIGFQGYDGRGYVIKDFKKFEGGAIQLMSAGKSDIKIIGAGAAIPSGFKNECASLVQYFGIPNTRTWLRGPRVCDFKLGELPEGTVVATLRDGKYYSDYSGRSHVGIYLRHDDYTNYLSSKNNSVGVTIMEQFNGHIIWRKTKAYSVEADKFGNPSSKCWTDSNGVVRTKRISWAADGEEYYVLLTNS